MKKQLLLIAFLLIATIAIFSLSTVSAATPTITGITASPNPIKGGTTITTTAHDVNDSDQHNLFFYCNETAPPDQNNNVCFEKDTQYYPDPYSGIKCDYNVATDDTNHTIYCRLFDGNNYSADRNTTFTTDSTPPVTLFSGCNNQWNETDRTIVLTCAGGETCATSLLIDDGNINGNVITTDGNHNIEYFSTDTVGNIEVKKTDYCAIDKTVPTIKNFLPATATNNSTPTISFDLNDAASGLNLALTTIKIDGNTVTSASHISYVLPYAVQDKNIVVDINATDNAGHNLLASIGFLVDTVAPTTTASGCSSNGWNTTDQTIVLTCNSPDYDTTRYRIDNGALSSLVLTTDGDHTIEFDSNDHAGNREITQTIHCAIDKSGPSVSLSATTSGHTVYLNWSATDVSGIQNVTLFREGVSAGSILSQNPYQWPETSDGTYHYRVMATDNVGHDANSSEISVPVSSSSTGSSSGSSSSGNPASIWITLSISSADFAKAGKFPITINGDEPFEGGYQIKIKLPNSSTFKDIASAASYSGKSVTVEYEFKNGDDGNASIVAVAWSSSGSRAEKEKTITIDTKIPSIELLAPKANDLLSGTAELKANAADGNVAVKEVSFYYRKGNSGDWQPIPASATRNGNSWSGKWNTAGLSDAKYQFKAVASDAAGNKAEKIIELKVSNIAGLGITGKAEVQSEALFSFKESDLNAMFASVLANNSLAEEAKEMATDCNVSRILKIIKITDGNKTTYKASVFLGFRNNSRQNMSVRLVEVIPKDFAENAGAIESAEPFSIIESDPIVVWDLNNVPAGKAVEIVYSLKNSLTEEFATKLAKSGIMQKFAAPPIVVSSTSQLGKNDFSSTLTSATTTGFFGIANGSLLAIIVGLIVAAIIVSALFFARSGFSFGSKSGYASASPLNWAYKEAMHEKIIDKIGTALNEFIGYKQQGGRKWVFKKEPATGLETKKEGGLKQLFGNLEFTIAKKTEKQKLEGKSKWAFKEQNADI